MLTNSPSGRRGRSFSGLKEVFGADLASSALLQRLASAMGRTPGRVLAEDEEFVTLQVGRKVFANAPRRMRVELWMSSLHSRGVGVAAAAKYEDMLLAPVGEEAASDIQKDLARTFPSTRRFSSPEGQAALWRVLRAYAAHDPEVGYCQGLNFVAALLLSYLPERNAFGGLVVMMQDRGLRRLYSTDMQLLQAHLWQLGRLMPQRLCAHLERIMVTPLLYGASWMMTCFASEFPLSFSARVMDAIMADKMDQALLKVSVALLKSVEGRLLEMRDMEDCLKLLKLELPNWSEQALHDVLTEAFERPWTPQQQQLLASVEGAESVAEAVERVQRANLSGGAGAGASAGAGGASGGGRRSSGGAGGPSRSPGGSGGGGGALALSVPPPPSPRRTAGQSPHGSRRASDRDSAGGLPELPPPPPGGAAEGEPRQQQQKQQQQLRLSICTDDGAAGPLGNGAVSASEAATSSGGDALPLIDLSSPLASPRGGAAVDGWGAGGSVAAAAGGQACGHGAADAWDPFGANEPETGAGASALAPPPQQQQQQQRRQQQHQQELLRQQFQELSFTQLTQHHRQAPSGSPLGPAGHQQQPPGSCSPAAGKPPLHPQQQQQQQQQQHGQHVSLCISQPAQQQQLAQPAPQGAASAADDEWWDFDSQG